MTLLIIPSLFITPPPKKETIKKPTKVAPKVKKENVFSTPIKKKKIVKKKTGPSIYSKEYLEEKHGIKIDGNNSNIPKKKLDKNNLYLKFHEIESIKVWPKMTMVDVKQGEYDSQSNEMVREIRRYYHFYNVDEVGWKLYMIADAKIEN